MIQLPKQLRPEPEAHPIRRGDELRFHAVQSRNL
jgi:hypothetical protein